MFTIINFYSWMFCIAGRIVTAIGESCHSGLTAPLPKICFCYDPSSLLFHFFALVPIFLTNSCRNANATQATTLLATQAVMLLMPVRDFSWEIFKIPLKYRKLHIKMEHWILFVSFLLNSVDAWYCQILIISFQQSIQQNFDKCAFQVDILFCVWKQ